MTSPHVIEAEYDLVFSGGGTVACAHHKQHIQPGQFFTYLAPTSPTVKYVVSKPSDYLTGRSLAIPTGRCIGGSSSINTVVYNHPAASNFDDWENDFSNPVGLPRSSSRCCRRSLAVSVGGFKVRFQVETYEIDPDDLAKQFVDEFKLGPKFEKDRPLTDDGNEFGTGSINAFHVRRTLAAALDAH
ncbi:hypothetical protein GGX14DRAFT_625567 [Mycena pura]|uniref:Glucose-methanol-choline oxidoreductase N-terminal domain-containing protein n=1 Tax=Mycena pura TaxID=153505 RepID=A0AAD6VI95_9AGAR|nr:hypothetical protein GGX14DRAFT_625567 [Mycena pura]